jgi:hypothetical protein
MGAEGGVHERSQGNHSETASLWGRDGRASHNPGVARWLGVSDFHLCLRLSSCYPFPLGAHNFSSNCRHVDTFFIFMAIFSGSVNNFVIYSMLNMNHSLNIIGYIQCGHSRVTMWEGLAPILQTWICSCQTGSGEAPAPAHQLP